MFAFHELFLYQQTPTLTHLELRGCELNDRTVPVFGRALKLGCHLTVLHMEKMFLSGRALVILCECNFALLCIEPIHVLQPFTQCA